MSKFDNDILLSDFSSCVIEKDNVTSLKSEKNRWKLIPYKSGLTEGVMLFANSNDLPSDVTIPLNANGKYDVYVGVLNVGIRDSINVKLSSHSCFTTVETTPSVSDHRWRSEESAQELYLFTADISGESLIVNRQESGTERTSALLWVRCVPAKEDALNDFSNNSTHKIQYHFDGDITLDVESDNPTEYVMKHFALKDSDVDFLSAELLVETASCDSFLADANAYSNAMRVWSDHNRSFYKLQEKINDIRLKMAKEYGHRIYATFRMQISDFGFPYNMPLWKPAFNGEEGLRCVWRDSTRLDMFSYAFEEVRNYTINLLTNAVRKGYDGVSLILTRGLHIGFEKPVLDLFKERYGDIDPTLLPLNDDRLIECRGHFMNVLLRDLRSSLDVVAKEQNRKIGINVISNYSLDTALNFGLDIENWAKQGYITEATQADMEMFEDLEGCMSDEKTELIDLNKYSQKLKTKPIICRNYATNMQKTLEGLKSYLELEENYDVKVYAILPWTHCVRPEEYAKAAEKLYEAGAKRLHMWNTGQCLEQPAEWNVVKRLGHKDELHKLSDQSVKYYNTYRMLNLDNIDISLFSPNWRG